MGDPCRAGLNAKKFDLRFAAIYSQVRTSPDIIATYESGLAQEVVDFIYDVAEKGNKDAKTLIPHIKRFSI